MPAEVLTPKNSMATLTPLTCIQIAPSHRFLQLEILRRPSCQNSASSLGVFCNL
ncbi:hypothetical protein Hanom_Chr02g00148901 [Helianthus anomalus]